MLFISTGERSDRDMRMHGQRLDSNLGKILRIRPDGSVPQDNPFFGQAGALPEILSYGHRNGQALAFDRRGAPADVPRHPSTGCAAPDGALYM